jgi:hypothetical protein
MSCCGTVWTPPTVLTAGAFMAVYARQPGGLERMTAWLPRAAAVAVDEHGNTSAASIPLALDVAVRDGRIQRGHKLMLEGVGGGFTWGAALLTY